MMKMTKLAVLGSMGLVAALAAGGCALAQTRTEAETVTVPPDYIAVMVPEAPPVPVVGDPLAFLPAPPAWVNDGMMQTAFNGVEAIKGPVAAEVVTSISNGRQHCTQQLVYPSTSGSVKPKVIDFGNACRALAADFPHAQPMKVNAVKPGATKPISNMAV